MTLDASELEQLSNLIDRCEKAAKPSKALDADVAMLLVWGNHQSAFYSYCGVQPRGSNPSKRDYLIQEIHALLRGPGLSYAIVERQIAMPRQASTSTFATGRGQGIIEGLLTGLSIPYEMVDSAKWKKAMGIPAGSDKGASRVMAMRLFPHLADRLGRVKDDGRAEALLLAEYLRRIRGGTE